MPVTPQDMYESMVVSNRGSYCFGQNGLLLGMLRGLGYRAYAAAGRVLVPPPPPAPPSAPPVYSAPHHLVLLVQPHNPSSPLGNVTYMVDVGFGGTGPVRPILLADGSASNQQRTADDGELDEECVTNGGWVWGTYPPERHRLVCGALPGSSLETRLGSGRAPARDWHLQVSHASVRPSSASAPSASAKPEWTTLYSFTEAEFFQADIDAASFAVSYMSGSIFLTSVICTRRFHVALQCAEDEEEVRLREDEGGHDATTQARSVSGDSLAGGAPGPFVGKWNLEGGRATKRIGRGVVQERTFTTESERLAILKDVFGVGVRPEDEQWIVGWPAALQPNTLT
ncbi:cysteine proteinase [Rhodofomes roseus]|uniref:Cysteine proteinase n=1 Tax=Rhodofomes roseus TaxID=34475 RepID=A0ABQ8KQP6_9APHY|nr:cysteine proteinase [Rhodofomes roseus]KAH9840855.1 cysteine proteinase [Rhodofomes roseus]